MCPSIAIGYFCQMPFASADFRATNRKCSGAMLEEKSCCWLMSLPRIFWRDLWPPFLCLLYFFPPLLMNSARELLDVAWQIGPLVMTTSQHQSSLSLKFVLYHSLFLQKNYHLYRAKARFSALNQFRYNTHQLNLSMCPCRCTCNGTMVVVVARSSMCFSLCV